MLGPRGCRLARGGLPCARPDNLAAPVRLGPLEFTADVVTAAGDWTFQTEEGPAVPTGARDSLGDGRERAMALAVPRKSIVEHHHLMGGLFPCADQLGAGLDARLGHDGIERAVAGCFCDLAQPALGGLRQPAIRLDLHLVGDRADQQLASEEFRRRTAIHSLPARAQFGEAEIT